MATAPTPAPWLGPIMAHCGAPFSMFRVTTLDGMPGAPPDGALCPLVGVRFVAPTNFRGAASAPSPGRGLSKSGSALVERAT